MKSINRTIKIIIHLFAVALVVFFALKVNRVIDRYFMLEENKPAYYYFLEKAQSELVVNGESHKSDAYRVLYADKDGFGAVSWEDLFLYLRKMQYLDPKAHHLLIMFQDGTGMEIPLLSSQKSLYGILDENGKIIKEAIYLDYREHLSSQVDGLSIITYKTNENDFFKVAYAKESYGSNIIERHSFFQEQPSGVYGREEKWIDDNLVELVYLDQNGNRCLRKDGFASMVTNNSEGGKKSVSLLDEKGDPVTLFQKNLVQNMEIGPSGWTRWMTPQANEENSCFNIGQVVLDDKRVGDLYSCQIEVEFANVSASNGQDFLFLTQGAQDGQWITGNVWNSSLICLKEVPKDGIYKFTSTVSISEDMEGISIFNIGFRCDNWSSGSFRVRNVKIEKGDQVTEWSSGI